MKGITKWQSERLSITNGRWPLIIDDWEIAHIEMSTDEYYRKKEIVGGVGFAIGLTAKDIALAIPEKESRTQWGITVRFGWRIYGSRLITQFRGLRGDGCIFAGCRLRHIHHL